MTVTNLSQNPAVNAMLTNGLRDIKPPVEIPNGWAWVGWAAAGLALAALLVWAWKTWRKKRAMAPSVPVTPPHIVARRRLQEALALIDRPKEFCTAVSDIVRWYLEHRFEFHAPERTTEEFLHELRGTPLLTPDQKQSLGEFLNRCDLVKFARYEPREPELHDLHDAALRLIEETEPVLDPGPPGGSGEAAPNEKAPAESLADASGPASK